MQKNTTKRKNKTVTSEDIKVNRNAVTKVILPNIDNPSVLEINLSMFVAPNQERNKDEYNEQIKRIVKSSQRILRRYVLENQDLFDKRSILDINFTSANLRKGYNKSVQMSLFVRQNKPAKFSRIRNDIKGTIKETVHLIIDKIREEDFKCYKTKQSINARR